MSTATRQPNLFEGVHTGPNEYGYHAPNYEETMPGIVRPRLQAMLDEARAAARMPWSLRNERVNALLFHNMANWLPPPERDELRAAFLAELNRLHASSSI